MMRNAREASQQQRAAEQAQRDEAAKKAAADAAALAERQKAEAAALAERQKQQAAAQAEQRRQQAAAAQKLGYSLAWRSVFDAAAGYKRTTFLDFLVDYREAPGGAKVILSGYSTHLGQIDALAPKLFSTEVVYLDSSNLSRETRKGLLRCQEESNSGCLITVWAHTGCTMTMMGHETEAPCLILDGVWDGTYEHPSAGVEVAH